MISGSEFPVSRLKLSTYRKAFGDAMSIDYLYHSKLYRPEIIRTLLIGEAPPPNGRSYFYLPTALSQRKKKEDDRSLPATIFYHYFDRLPLGEGEYKDFLVKLRSLGIFLVDIVDEPILVRNCPEGVEKVKAELPRLQDKLNLRGIFLSPKDMVFLLARRNYESIIRQEFPEASRIRWKEFRMNFVNTFEVKQLGETAIDCGTEHFTLLGALQK